MKLTACYGGMKVITSGSETVLNGTCASVEEAHVSPWNQ